MPQLSTTPLFIMHLSTMLVFTMPQFIMLSTMLVFIMPLYTMLLFTMHPLTDLHLPTNLHLLTNLHPLTNLHLPMKDLLTTTLPMLLLMATLVLTLDTTKLVMDMLPMANTMSFFPMAAPKLSPTPSEMITLDMLPTFNTLVKLKFTIPNQLTNLLPNHMLDNLYCHLFL